MLRAGGDGRRPVSARVVNALNRFLQSRKNDEVVDRYYIVWYDERVRSPLVAMAQRSVTAVSMASVLMGLAAIIVATVAYSQSARDQHSRLLKPYLTPRTVTNLEWDLLQFNMLWQGSHSGDVSYLTSFPVIFDPKAMRFRATFAVQEKRTYDEPSPFLSWSNSLVNRFPR